MTTLSMISHEKHESPMATSMMDARNRRAESAAAALNAVVKKLAEEGDVDPVNVLDVCEAADIDEFGLQRLLDDYRERRRLLDLIAEADKIRRLSDAAQAASTKARVRLETQEEKLKAAEREYMQKRNFAAQLRGEFRVAQNAAGQVLRPKFARFASPNEIAEQEIRARNKDAAAEQAHAVDAARQRCVDAKANFREADCRIRSALDIIASLNTNPQRHVVQHELDEKTKQLADLRADRKIKSKALSAAHKARTAIEK